jgi:hypothetical protein
MQQYPEMLQFPSLPAMKLPVGMRRFSPARKRCLSGQFNAPKSMDWDPPKQLFLATVQKWRNASSTTIWCCSVLVLCASHFTSYPYLPTTPVFKLHAHLCATYNMTPHQYHSLYTWVPCSACFDPVCHSSQTTETLAASMLTPALPQSAAVLSPH